MYSAHTFIVIIIVSSSPSPRSLPMFLGCRLFSLCLITRRVGFCFLPRFLFIVFFDSLTHWHTRSETIKQRSSDTTNCDEVSEWVRTRAVRCFLPRMFHCVSCSIDLITANEWEKKEHGLLILFNWTKVGNNMPSHTENQQQCCKKIGKKADCKKGDVDCEKKRQVSNIWALHLIVFYLFQFNQVRIDTLYFLSSTHVQDSRR